MNTTLIVPVKSLSESKSRLANILTARQRTELTSQLLLHLLRVSQQIDRIEEILVVTPDPEVESFANQNGVLSLLEGEKRGLNWALGEARNFAAQEEVSILILPCDLPFISKADIESLLSPLSALEAKSVDPLPTFHRELMVICPDRHEQGTNALLLTNPSSFTFHFGPNSFQKHLEEARCCGFSVKRVDRKGIIFDLDTEEDWRSYLERTSRESLHDGTY